jgi:hypothetical protein
MERAQRAEPRKATQVDEAVGRQIRKRRRVLGMSQHQLARAIGIASQQIQKYEIGENRLVFLDWSRLLLRSTSPSHGFSRPSTVQVVGKNRRVFAYLR